MQEKHRCISAGIIFVDIGCEPIDHSPKAGELVPTTGVHPSLGGCASNVAINLARLGVPVGLCGCIGTGPLSDFVVNALKDPLIDTAKIKRSQTQEPGCTMIINVKGEDRRFVSTTGANAEFELNDIPDDWSAESDVLYLGGFLMMPLLESPKTIDFMKNYRKQGGKIILDVVLYGDRPYQDAILPLLPYVDYFMPNDDEGQLISGLEDPLDQAKFFADAGAPVSVITCGSNGSLYYSEKEKFRTGIFSVDFIGGTGSGDAFAAGFAAALLDNADPYLLMKRASAQGMSCVRHRSATESVFTRKEMEAFLADHDLSVQSLE
ncbi:MAG: carbohydrate kinase family protein [Planctomycetia bacterium]|nr:carbohydrate kinase family protein [Planctomycetia bacterium]